MVGFGKGAIDKTDRTVLKIGEILVKKWFSHKTMLKSDSETLRRG